ncbi:hypothetical protein [Vibrio vulnificus]|uniref:hypothetical protein n=1 Tax=Vibrio vulnificus TaxID=672 RepID=UPI000364FE65|nr:hypothetical protein [Vibrio vulnificus]ASM97572.1 hypothetical protein AOT11_20925 [Vibrio vulnificus NBRC 15645 = ATCC 27562]MCL7020977.1 hypothetical protein [Vibrio vulnificus]MDK2702430.1 hypothetical protein [Vibrio vulnificus]QET76427.1 hypothetical protein FOB71_16225 [Vibrio vulnificus]SUP55202.1 Uncharacterised protein [Vibrio vulnificus]
MKTSTLRIFSGLALLGFCTTVFINLCSHFSIELSEAAIFIPQVFVIGLAFPLVKMCNETTPVHNNGNLMHIFSATKGKYLLVLALVVIYGGINFFYFIHLTKPFPRGEAPLHIQSGIFSSMQMIFAFLELIIATALIKITGEKKVT